MKVGMVKRRLTVFLPPDAVEAVKKTVGLNRFVEKVFFDLYSACNGDKEKMKELVMDYFSSGETLFKNFQPQEEEKREVGEKVGEKEVVERLEEEKEEDYWKEEWE